MLLWEYQIGTRSVVMAARAHAGPFCSCLCTPNPAGTNLVSVQPSARIFLSKHLQSKTSMKIADARRAALAPQALPASLHGSKALAPLRAQQVWLSSFSTMIER